VASGSRLVSPLPGAVGCAVKFRLAAPQAGERELDRIRQVFASGILTGGPVTAEFEAAFAARHGVEHAVALANGTVALTAIFLALGIGEGDEVIVPSLTFISSATSVLHVGATPVFAEVRPDTFNLDPDDVVRRITTKTRAILAVHYAGQPADMDELTELGTASDIFILEDSAEAHGASYHGRPVGSLATAAMFSFTPTKNITMGEGGIVTTANGELARQLRLLRNHGQTDLYHHAILGFNWRITEMQAAMGVVQLERLDDILEVKRRNAATMAHRLRSIPGIAPPLALEDRTHAYMLYTTTLDAGIDRDAVIDRLATLGVQGRLYFPAIHRQPIFRSSSVDLPVTDELCDRILSLPFHALLDDGDLDEIADAVEEAIRTRG
jgi:perosamine synthetase